jgi:hypothetical protein
MLENDKKITILSTKMQSTSKILHRIDDIPSQRTLQSPRPSSPPLPRTLRVPLSLRRSRRSLVFLMRKRSELVDPSARGNDVEELLEEGVVRESRAGTEDDEFGFRAS